MPKVYAFDIDETMEISNGPVTIQSIIDLFNEGHIVGLCGNWALFVNCIPQWHRFISFVNAGLHKPIFLNQIKTYVRADDYVMVGNVPGEKNCLGFVCASEDSKAATEANWRFIKEDDFAKGTR